MTKAEKQRAERVARAIDQFMLDTEAAEYTDTGEALELLRNAGDVLKTVTE